MRAGIATIRKELAGIYNRHEIESLIGLIFKKLKGLTRTQLLLVDNEQLSDKERDKLDEIIRRLKEHEPIQYILGITEFYGLNFNCVPGVLIPRPETEELVDWIIKENSFVGPVIIDMGTGTGCIAVSLQKNIPGSTVFACDISPVCIETATQNAKLNGSKVVVVKYDMLKGDLLAGFPPFDIVVSNPPYVRESEKIGMEKNVTEFEPGLALFVSDENPLIFYEKIADFALLNLKDTGRLYFEINEALGDQTCDMLKTKGFTDIVLKKDLNSRNRMVRGCFNRQ